MRSAAVAVLVDQDPLHPDAALSRLVEGAEDDPLGSVREVGVAVHDHGGVAAQLEHHLLVAGLGLELPADRGRAREGEQLQALVGREAIRLLARHRQDREGAHRKLGLGEHLADDQRPHRRQARGLQDEGAAGGDRGRHLVRGEVEREVEGRYQGAGADRHALPHSGVIPGARADVEGQHLAGDAHRFLGGDAEGIDQPADLHPGILDRLARLDAERHRELLGARGEAGGAVLQHLLALVGGELAHRGRRRSRQSDRAVDRGRACQRDLRGDLARELVPHGERLIDRHRTVAEIVGVALL
jgi:hypothetical protein